MRLSNSFLGLFAVLVVFVVLLYPRASTAEYILQLIHAKKVNTAEFWQFREYIAPGHFTFDRQGFQKKAALTHVSLSTSDLMDSDARITLQFSSRNVRSIEMLTRAVKLNESIKLPKGRILYRSSQSVLIQATDGYYLIYMQTIPELLRVNGFYKYAGKDEKLLNSYKKAVTVSKIAKKGMAGFIFPS